MSERSNVKERGRLHVIVGAARSGKSTFANQWVKFADEAINKLHEEFKWGRDYWFSYARPRVVIAGDDFRLAMHGREYSRLAEGTVFAMMDVAIRALLGRGFDVLVDETCTTRATLLRMLQLDPDPIFIWIETPESVCIERARANGQDYLVEPIKRMCAQMKELKEDFPQTLKRLTEALKDNRGWGELR